MHVTSGHDRVLPRALEARTLLGAKDVANRNEVLLSARVAGVRYCSTCCSAFRSDFERCPNDGGELQVSTVDPLLGRTLGDRYVIEQLIGEGAMGRVYRARHRVFADQRYAVKVLVGDLAASSTMRMRFAREAQNASRLDHPNVVNVIDFGKTERGLHYLVMDLVEGESLADIVRRGPLSATRVIRIARQLCEGLDHAHGRGMIHRDFKSENILVVSARGSEREVARIADFGLAMSLARDVRLTTTGVACTPAYAAPEQLRGTAIDHRVDLYGLGVTMFEMLSGGELPFEGDIDSTIAAKLLQEAPSIATRAPNVPPGLVALVARLLASDPAQRPRSAREVIQALETSRSPPVQPVRVVAAKPPARPRARVRSRGAPVRGVMLVTSLAVLSSLSIHALERAEPHAAELAMVPELAIAPEPEPLRTKVAASQTDDPPPEPQRNDRDEVDEADPRAKARAGTSRRRTSARVATSVEPSALEVAKRYRAIGRRLAVLEGKLGPQRTLDLWSRYRRIRITAAMSSQDVRNRAAAALDRLQRAIDARAR